MPRNPPVPLVKSTVFKEDVHHARGRDRPKGLTAMQNDMHYLGKCAFARGASLKPADSPRRCAPTWGWLTSCAGSAPSNGRYLDTLHAATMSNPGSGRVCCHDC